MSLTLLLSLLTLLMTLLLLIFKGLLLLLLLLMPKLLHLLGELLLEESFISMSFNLLMLSLFSFFSSLKLSFFGVSTIKSKSVEIFSLMFSKTELDVTFFTSCRNLIAFMELQFPICYLHLFHIQHIFYNIIFLLHFIS